jgi:hypothetical protein
MQVNFEGRCLERFSDDPISRILRQGGAQGNGEEKKKAQSSSHDAALEMKSGKRAKMAVGRWARAKMDAGPGLVFDRRPSGDAKSGKRVMTTLPKTIDQ